MDLAGKAGWRVMSGVSRIMIYVGSEKGYELRTGRLDLSRSKRRSYYWD